MLSFSIYFSHRIKSTLSRSVHIWPLHVSAVLRAIKCAYFTLNKVKQSKSKEEDEEEENGK